MISLRESEVVSPIGQVLRKAKVDELRIFKITEKREGDRIILTEMSNNCRRSQRDNDRVHQKKKKKKKYDTKYERKFTGTKFKTPNITSSRCHCESSSASSSLFFYSRFIRGGKFRRLGSCLKAKARSYFLYFKTRNSTFLFDTLRLSPNIFIRTYVLVYVHVSTSVSNQGYKCMISERFNGCYMRGIFFFFHGGNSKEAKGIEIGR